MTLKIFNLLCCVIVINGLLPVNSQALSGVSVILGNKHYYIETTNQGNFYEAANSCAELDMKLASIESKTEFDRLFSILKSGDNLGSSYWLGGISYGAAGQSPYSWLGTGKPISYWTGTKITDTDKCMQTAVDTFLFESATDCITIKTNNYICEKPLEPNCGKYGQCRYTYSTSSK